MVPTRCKSRKLWGQFHIRMHGSENWFLSHFYKQLWFKQNECRIFNHCLSTFLRQNFHYRSCLGKYWQKFICWQKQVCSFFPCTLFIIIFSTIHVSYYSCKLSQSDQSPWILKFEKADLERIGKIKYSKFSAFLYWVCEGFHSHEDMTKKIKMKTVFAE